MIQEQEINRALKEVVNSDTLSKSQHSKQLLEYLVKATLEKKDIKEYTIAHDIFKKESDTGVRAYIHNLRKKLDEYYAEEGLHSEFILTIPKGQYQVLIQKRDKRSSVFLGKHFRTALKGKYLIGTIGLIIAGTIIFLF